MVKIKAEQEKMSIEQEKKHPEIKPVASASWNREEMGKIPPLHGLKGQI